MVVEGGIKLGKLAPGLALTDSADVHCQRRDALQAGVTRRPPLHRQVRQLQGLRSTLETRLFVDRVPTDRENR